MVHGTARVTRFRLQRLAAFLQDTAARPTIVQYLDLLLRAWRNGRRSRLRIWSRKGWRFKSSRAHHSRTSKKDRLSKLLGQGAQAEAVKHRPSIPLHKARLRPSM